MNMNLKTRVYRVESRVYCEVEVPVELITIICRQLKDGSALCVAWEGWSSDAPPCPSMAAKARAERAAAEAFRKVGV